MLNPRHWHTTEISAVKKIYVDRPMIDAVVIAFCEMAVVGHG